MSVVFPYSLFFLSFSPLWLSILFIDAKSILIDKSKLLYTEYISVICILLATLISLFIVLNQLKIRGKEGSQRETIESVREEKSVTAEYLLSYILPLFAFNFTTWDAVVLFLLFFLTLGFLCIRHRYFSTNIVLELAGYRLYQCDIRNSNESARQQAIISKKRLNGYREMVVYIKKLNNDLALHIADAD